MMDRIKSKYRLPLVGVLAGMLLSMLAGIPAQADMEKGTHEVGFDIGATYFDADLAEIGPRVTARGGYFFSDLFELEGQIGVSGGAELGKPDVTYANLFANGVFNFWNKKNVVPYVLIGVGASRVELEGVGDDYGISGQISGGARLFGSGGTIGLRMEGGVMAIESFDQTFINYNFQFGFTFPIGGKHPHPKRTTRETLPGGY